MKTGKVFTALALAWVLFIFLDNISAIVRAIHVRRMNRPLRAAYSGVRWIRSALLFSIAVINLFMIVRQAGRESRMS
jgi:hypothetical protein